MFLSCKNVDLATHPSLKFPALYSNVTLALAVDTAHGVLQHDSSTLFVLLQYCGA